MNCKIGFIGAGAMAEALIAGLTKAGMTPLENICASDIDPGRLGWIKDNYGIRTTKDNNELVRENQVIVIAVKPYLISEALPLLKEALTEDKLVISLAAGVSIAKLYQYIPEKVPVARVMPNTPALVGRGVSAVSFSVNFDEDEMNLVRKILQAVGTVHIIPEKLMDAVTGLSGSGPAYIYLVIEALSDAGVRAGIPREMALDMAVQTVIGAAAMVDVTGTHPAVLKEKVTTPGGTTITGLHILERAGVRAAFTDAVLAAAARSVQLGSDEGGK